MRLDRRPSSSRNKRTSASDGSTRAQLAGDHRAEVREHQHLEATLPRHPLSYLGEQLRRHRVEQFGRCRPVLHSRLLPSRPLPSRQNPKQVPFRLADPPPQRRQLGRGPRADQVVVRLAGADHGPLDVAERRPPAHPAGIGPRPPGGLVGGQERLQLAEPGDREIVVAEPPRADRQPGEVLGRVARVAKLPVDHRGEPVLIDDQVAEPEVAVDEPRRRGRRRVEAQPSQPGLDRGQRLADLVERRLPERARFERGILATGEALDRRRVDRVNLGERRRPAGPGAARAPSRARRGAAPAARPTSPRRGPSDSPPRRRAGRRRARRSPCARPAPRRRRRRRSHAARARAGRTTSRPPARDGRRSGARRRPRPGRSGARRRPRSG